MKRAIFKELSSKYQNCSLLSLNKYLYVLKSTLQTDGSSIQHATQNFQKYHIMKQFHFESNVRFDILEKREMLVITEELNKEVKFFLLKNILQEEQKSSESQFNELKEPFVSYLNKKKVTDLIGMHLESKEQFIDGVMISDKVGEVKFINFDRIINGKELPENEKEFLAKVLFGQQQECLALKLNDDKSAIIAIDTLNRVRISDFPNVFNIRQVILQHKNKITDFALINDKIATYSVFDNHLVIQDINSGLVIASKIGIDRENSTIEGIVCGKNGLMNQLCALIFDSAHQTYLLMSYSSDFQHTQTVLDGLKLEEGKNLKYVLTESELLKANIHPENGSIIGEELEIMLL